MSGLISCDLPSSSRHKTSDSVLSPSSDFVVETSADVDAPPELCLGLVGYTNRCLSVLSECGVVGLLCMIGRMMKLGDVGGVLLTRDI